MQTKKWMKKRHRRAKTMSSVWDSYPDIMLTLITVNMWGSRLYYKPLSDLFCRLTKAINSSFSFTGCCACCSVVAVICVCLLVYWDYAATSTGVGNQHDEIHKQTLCFHMVGLWVLNSDQTAPQDKSVSWRYRALKRGGFVWWYIEDRVHKFSWCVLSLWMATKVMQLDL